KPSTMMNALSRHDIYISTQTACSLADSPSTTLTTIYHDKERALSSLRISISHKTTKEEIDLFLKYFKEEYDNLKFMKEK
ncbi:MAG: cysteine desulfurase NifS, partial [Bacilli bacterium]|nr:cysteine desulfurase NifS [Bacilli bacterium]